MRRTGLWAALILLLSACTSTPGRPTASPSPSSTPSSTPSSFASATVSPTVAGTTAAANASAPATTLPPLSAPDEKPATQTEQLLADLNAADTPTLQQAIDAFSLSIASLPGASTSSLPSGNGLSGTVAWALLTSHRSELTAAQAQVLDSLGGTIIASTAVGGGHQLVATPAADASSSSSTSGSTRTTATTPRPSTSPTAPSPSPSATPASIGPTTTHSGLRRAVSAFVAPESPTTPVRPHDIDLMNQTLDDWVAYRPDLINRVGGFQLQVSTVEPKNHAEMDTRPSTTLPNGCLVTLYPVYTNGKYTDNLAKYVFAHELFHCIQFTWSNMGADPEWLVEGSAEFAALDLYRTTFQPVPSDSFEQWFTDPGRALGTDPEGQGYADWALFEAFKTWYATDPYPAIKAMISAGGSTPGILAAGHFDNQIFGTTWTSTSLRSTSWSDSAFQLKWPGVQPGYGKQDTALAVGSSGVGEFDVVGKGDFAHQQYTVGFSAAVGVVGVVPSGGPMLTHADAGPSTIGEGLQAWYCVQPEGCVCPDGMEPGVHLTALTPPMLFSFAAGSKIPQAAVTALPWDPSKYCTRKKSDDTGTNTDAGPSGTSNGDPHVSTYNGLMYDFMTYGEFATTQDSTGGFIVQERHQRAGFGTAVSAVAVGDGTHRITLTAASITPTAAITVKVDGTANTATSVTAGTMSLAGDPSDADPTWTVTWTDGSAVRARWGDGFFLTVVPAAARSVHLVGLLGKPGSFLDDLSLPDGTRSSPLDGYKSFADAYQVTAKTSLFDYDPGQGPDTFTQVPADATVTPPTAQVLAGCQSGLGSTATSGEVNACAFDITSVGSSLGTAAASIYTQAWTSVVQQRSTQIVGDPSQPRRSEIVVGSTSAGTGAAGNSAASGTGGSGGWNLTLSGTLDPHNDSSALTGNIALAVGTVLVLKAKCPTDPNTDVEVVVRDLATNGTSSVAVCGPRWKAEAYNINSNGALHDGETYLLNYHAGVYSISAQAFDDDLSKPGAAEPVVLQLSSAQAPTVITPAALPVGASQTISLHSAGDTIALEAVPGNGGTWTFTGADALCTQVYYIDPLSKGGLDDPVDLGPICWKHQEISIGPSATELPLLVFDRDGSAATVTVTRTK